MRHAAASNASDPEAAYVDSTDTIAVSVWLRYGDTYADNLGYYSVMTTSSCTQRDGTRNRPDVSGILGDGAIRGELATVGCVEHGHLHPPLFWSLQNHKRHIAQMGSGASLKQLKY